MAHYAILNENNIVITVITGRDENEIVDGISDWEKFYSIETGKTVKRTSFNTYGNKHKLNKAPFRKNFATLGGVYDEKNDAFYGQKPFPSWQLDPETFLWNPPIDIPNDGEEYSWNEDSLSWNKIS